MSHIGSQAAETPHPLPYLCATLITLVTTLPQIRAHNAHGAKCQCQMVLYEQLCCQAAIEMMPNTAPTDLVHLESLGAMHMHC